MPSSVPKRRAGIAPDINVTPLVDVVLVLLIIFMVVTPQMEAGVTVKLPSIANPDDGNGAMEPITVTVSAEGALYLEKDAVTRDVLLTRLEGLHQAQAERRVVLKADTALRYVKVRELFKACQSIGFPGVSLQVLDIANSKS